MLVLDWFTEILLAKQESEQKLQMVMRRPADGGNTPDFLDVLLTRKTTVTERITVCLLLLFFIFFFFSRNQAAGSGKVRVESLLKFLSLNSIF